MLCLIGIWPLKDAASATDTEVSFENFSSRLVNCCLNSCMCSLGGLLFETSKDKLKKVLMFENLKKKLRTPKDCFKKLRK